MGFGVVGAVLGLLVLGRGGVVAVLGADGEEAGPDVGASVGVEVARVGDSVGLVLGCCVEAMEGPEVGPRVGAPVARVGEYIGEALAGP